MLRLSKDHAPRIWDDVRHLHAVAGELARMRHQDIRLRHDGTLYRTYSCWECGVEIYTTMVEMSDGSLQFAAYTSVMDWRGGLKEKFLFRLGVEDGLIERNFQHYNDYVCGKLRIMG